jgi:hypothetical protein
MTISPAGVRPQFGTRFHIHRNLPEPTAKQIADKLVGIINADIPCQQDNITAHLEMAESGENVPATPIVVTTAVPGESGKAHHSELWAIVGNLLAGKLVTPASMNISNKADGYHLTFDA